MAHGRRSAVIGAIGIASWLLAAAAAWACVPGGEAGTLEVSPSQARAGEEIRISGTAGSSNPVSVHLASGSLLAQVPVAPGADGHGFQFATTITLPAETPVGLTPLVVSQDNLKWSATVEVLPRPAVVVASPGASADTADGNSSTALILASSAAILLLALLAKVVRNRLRRSPIEETPGYHGTAPTGTQSPPVGAQS